MSNQFKPGDLALLTRAINVGNVGKVVALVRSDCSEKVALPEISDRAFAANPKREVYWVIRGEFSAVSTRNGKIDTEYAACPQAWLMPLRGDFAPEQAQARKVHA